MKIPPATDPLAREGFYTELLQRCLVSREDRKAEYERLRAYFLFGSEPNSTPAIYNKIYPSLDLLTSFLFASDTTRFSIDLGASAAKAELPKVPVLNKRINDRWDDSNADIIVGGAVTWSLVYGSTLVKLVPKGRDIHPYLVEPHNFGVLNEGVPMLDRQEAFVHIYMTTRPQLNRELAVHRNRESLMSRVSARPRDDSMMPAGLSRIIMSGTYPIGVGSTMTGAVEDVLAGTLMYRPRTQEELVEMYELYVWNDDADDWQIVTMTDPQVVIYDRPIGEGATPIFMKGEHPFTQICPNFAPDYFWGHSEVQRLIPLQELREHHLKQLTELVDRNVSPPKATQGVWQMPDEKAFALRQLNALVSSNDPTAKITEFKPQIPQELFGTITHIDSMFDEMISLSHLLRGQGDVGVRSEGQTTSLLRVGSSRPKARALKIEDSLERIATLYLQLDQKRDDRPLVDEQGQKFTSAQFTEDYMVKVDAHSSSPIFVEDQKQMAFELFKAQVIDGEELLQMVRPQNLQVLIAKWRVMQTKIAAQQAEMQQIAKADAQAKSLRSVPGGKP